MREAILLGSAQLRERPALPLRHEDRVPSEAVRPARRWRDDAARLAARRDDLAAVGISDRAGRRGGAIREGAEHPGDRLHARALLEPLHERAGEAAPRVEREPAVLDEHRTRQHRVRGLRLLLDDPRRVERLRLGQVEVEPLDDEAQTFGLFGLFGATGHEDQREPDHAGNSVTPRCRLTDAVLGVSPLFFGATMRTRYSPARLELRKIEG